MIGLSAEQYVGQAMNQAQAGNEAAALATLAQAKSAHPDNARIWHFAGNLLLRSGKAEDAAEHFGKAFSLDPANFDMAIDQSIALTRQGNYAEALAVLAQVENTAKRHAHFWSTRANAARGIGDLKSAAQWYDRALKLEPMRPKALHGRAAVALERGEPDAVERFDKALQANQSDPQAWLGKAQALDTAGRTEEAIQIAEALTGQLPQWIDGLRLLAQLRLGRGDADFAAPYREAAKRLPQDTNIPAEHCKELAALGRAKEAAEVAAEARRRFPDNPYFAMLEAMQSGAAGDEARAEEIWLSLNLDRVDRHVFEARHWVRTGDIDRASKVIDKALAAAPWDIGAWALRDVIWRMNSDKRHAWLHGQEGMVRLLSLVDADKVLPSAITILDRLHDNAHHPLGQSLRNGGTQTQGRLFDRYEPEIQALHQAIAATVSNYKAQLPPMDESHPLLRHRESDWRFSGSWSIRFMGNTGHHTAHLHPEGIVSSACYLVLPPDLGAGESEKAGWIELGRPAPDLRLDLGPLHEIKPETGHLALFPSTLYHGTNHFKEGRRMTVAFDVIPATQQP